MKVSRLYALFSLLLFCLTVSAQPNPVPFLTAPLIPASVNPGHAAFTLTVHGTGFVPGAVVTANGKPLATTFVAADTLQVKIPAQAVAQPSTTAIAVNNPGSSASNTIYFPVRNSVSTLGFHARAFVAAGAAAAGDLNRDGKVDIGVVNGGCPDGDCYGGLAIALNGGSGQFTISSSYKGTMAYPGGLQVIDANNDGRPDLAACWTYGSDGGEDVVLGDGKGKAMNIVRNHGGCGPFADLNGHGNIDYVAAVYDGASYTFVNLGNGDGTFSTTQYLSTDINVGGIAIGDFNHDGRLDIAVASNYPTQNLIEIFLADDDGTFTQGNQYTVPYNGYYLSAADLNGDGKLDLVTNGVSVLLGNGDGTFAVAGGVGIPNGSQDATTTNVVFGDFNGDGKLDVALVSLDASNNQTLNVLLGNGDGTFQNPQTFPAGASNRYQYFAINSLDVADFNNDGLLDAVVGSSSDIVVMSQTAK